MSYLKIFVSYPSYLPVIFFLLDQTLVSILHTVEHVQYIDRVAQSAKKNMSNHFQGD